MMAMTTSSSISVNARRKNPAGWFAEDWCGARADFMSIQLLKFTIKNHRACYVLETLWRQNFKLASDFLANHRPKNCCRCGMNGHRPARAGEIAAQLSVGFAGTVIPCLLTVRDAFKFCAGGQEIRRQVVHTVHGAGCSLPLFLKQGAAAGAPVCDRLKPFSRPAAFNISLVAATVGGWTR